jgi:two-component system CheB/CheR fusion protein
MSNKETSPQDGASVASTAETDEPDPATEPPPEQKIPIVAVAASAGGLSAFRALLSHLPLSSGLAFVLIQHLDPKHKSILTELLSHGSNLPVAEAGDGMPIEPDHVYVIPPGHLLSVLGNVLYLLPRGDSTQRFYPADVFFQSVAEDRGAGAVGVVLSGTASDGTKGSCAIRSVGGTTFAQDRDSAEFGEMPGNAVAAGCIDFVLPPEEIARELGRVARHPRLRAVAVVRRDEMALAITPDQLNKILIMLRARTGRDFSGYKPTTITRRINKRLVVQKIHSIEHYLKALQKYPEELDALFSDLLINVTAFFRDAYVFNDLKSLVLPQLVQDRPSNLPVRIWVPGCATGQEVYSVAMLVHETLDSLGMADQVTVQIFGSDIDTTAIESARRGLYADAYMDDVSAARRLRYFQRVAGGYQINRQLRDMCVFAVQDVIKDPPFSRLDLVSCRNLLIYLDASLQKRVLGVLHYALQPDGFLMLGSSETIGSRSDLFSVVSKKSKIYQKKSVAVRVPERQGSTSAGTEPQAGFFYRELEEEPVYDLDKEAERVLLQRYVPPGVVVNAEQVILRFFGRTWPYIEPASGAASLNLYKNAHPDIIIELRAAIHTVHKGADSVRKENVRVVVDGKERRVDISVISLGGAVRGESNLMVMFEPRPAIETPPSAAKASGGEESHQLHAARQRTLELERELASTREYMQSIVEEQEGTNEELRSANEEIQSTNEELQSTNEELETAKEELQSANEELATVNEELETRNQLTDRANSDLVNLLDSINIPIVILGADLQIRQFTPPARKLLNLIDTDIGRPIGNIKTNIDIPNLESEVLHVIDAMVSTSMELQDNSGHWYSVRLKPYRTLDKRIDGAVVTFVDIDNVKAFESTRAALQNERRLATIVRDSSDAVTLQDFDGNVLAWNPAAAGLYGYSEDEALGMNIRKILPEADYSKQRELYAALRRGESPYPIEVSRISKQGGIVRVLLVASALLDKDGKPAAVATTEKIVQS